jgi:actin beta/gamma 1
MVKLLTERGREFSTSAERAILSSIQESLYYVAINFDEEVTKAASSNDIEQT